MAWSTLTTIPGRHGQASNTIIARATEHLLHAGSGYQAGLTNAASQYNVRANTWTNQPDQTLAPRTYPGPAFIHNDSLWYISNDTGHLTSVNLTTGVPTSHVDPNGFLFDATLLVMLGGEFFAFGSDSGSFAPRRYDPSTNTWSGIASAGHSIIFPSVAPDHDTGLLYVKCLRYNGDTTGGFIAFNASANTWSTLTADPGPLQGNTVGVVFDGTVFLPGGMTPVSPFTNLYIVREYDIVNDSWAAGTSLPYAAGAEATRGALLMDVARATSLVTLSVTNGNPYTGTIRALPLEAQRPPEVVHADLTVALSVELPIVTSDAFLTVTLDVTGGPGVSADLLVTFNTGRVVTSNALVSVDVGTAPAAWAPPPPVTPPGVSPVVPPRTLAPEEQTVYPVMNGADQYELTWRFGTQLAGTVTSYGANSDPQPEDGFNLDGTPTASLDWGNEPPVTRTHAYPQPTVELASTESLPELMPIEELPDGNMLSGCLSPHATSLCSGSNLSIRCATIALLPTVLPTRLELAQTAATELGLTLTIQGGTSGLTNPSGLVDEDYRTLGKTLQQVLDDLLLGAGAPVWYAPGTVIIHGGGLPTATLEFPTLRGVGGSSSIQPGAVFDTPEPQLADYLADCRDQDNDPGSPCNQETFETAYSGTLTWVERAGSGRSYTEVRTTLTKSHGQIVLEEIVTSRAIWTLSGDPLGGGSTVVAPVEWTTREHTYLACCPTALSHSLERTWVTRFNDDPGATYETAAGVYLSAYKEVTQEWHAEGWLRSRIEVSHSHHGWNLGPGLVVTPTYKTASRTEQYVPVGKGMWYINTSVSDSVLMPVGENLGSAPVGTHWGAVVNNYTVVTDQAPAQVTCDEPGSDPCQPAPCATVREADYDRDHAVWAAVRDAWDANNPSERLVTTITYAGRLLLMPGMVTPHGLIAGVSWSGSGDRTDSPGESTTVEYWAVAQ